MSVAITCCLNSSVPVRVARSSSSLDQCWFTYSHWSTLLPPANEVWGKVIISVVCVKNSVHKGGGWYPSMHCRWYPSMPCSRGVISQHALQVSMRTPGGSWGVWLGGGLQAHTWGAGGSPGPHPGGSPGPHPGGGCIPACTETDTPPTATAAGGTYPTGMHCCLFIYSDFCRETQTSGCK